MEEDKRDIEEEEPEVISGEDGLDDLWSQECMYPRFGYYKGLTGSR